MSVHGTLSEILLVKIRGTHFFYFPGNVKQVLTILFAVTIFDLTITKTNAFGILLTLIGGAWYAAVDYREKKSHNYRG